MSLCNRLLLQSCIAVFEQTLQKIFCCVSVRQRPWHRSATWGRMAVLRAHQQLMMTCMKILMTRMKWQLGWRQPDTSDKDSIMLPTVRNFDHLGNDLSTPSLLFSVPIAGYRSFVC